jgi:spermidine/putrescine transport system ATP-binding protein
VIPKTGVREVSDFLVFDKVTKQFGSLKAVDAVDFSVQKGEFFSLLGPSGCGKTTLLRMLGGFETPDSGRIYLDGRDITDLPPNLRRVHTIFQNYALFPNMTVWDNIAFSLRVAHYPHGEVRKSVQGMLELIKMTEHAYKYPSQISGGQKQRVAIARALVDRPQVLLLDEPLAALDLKLRQHMLLELDIIHDEVGITFVYVTHDQGEAMSLSDRIAVMNQGHIEQLDPPAKIYEAPRSGFVAAFIGDTNFFEGTVTEIDGDYCKLAVKNFDDILCFNDKNITAGSQVHLSVRPEKIRVTPTPPPPEKGSRINVFRCKVTDIVYQGTYTKYWVLSRSGEHRIAAIKPHSRFLLDQAPITWGDEVYCWWHPDDGYMLEQFTAADADLVQMPPLGYSAPKPAAAPVA